MRLIIPSFAAPGIILGGFLLIVTTHFSQKGHLINSQLTIFEKLTGTILKIKQRKPSIFLK